MTNVKTAITVDEQIKKLRARGMLIDFEQEGMVKEALLDIGYYRLGFYWFPFERTYPKKRKRDHRLKENTIFDYAIKLYYFYFNLRNILLRYISRIEVNFRTTLIYYVSNAYKENSFWYTDKGGIKASFLNDHKYKTVLNNICQEPPIKLDLKAHCRNSAPVWKALEFMSFGTIIGLYENLNNPKLQCDIASIYGMTHPSQFANYLNVIRRLRNCCAHGKVLFDLKLHNPVGGGPLGDLGNQRTMLAGAYFVLRYFLKYVSQNRVNEMKEDMKTAYSRIEYKNIIDLVQETSGLKIEDL